MRVIKLKCNKLLEQKLIEPINKMREQLSRHAEYSAA